MFNFYKEHSRLKGFSVFKRSAVNVWGESRKYQTISCDKGRKAIGAKSLKRINCLAKISTILRENGMWQISKVISSHNHELEPSMSRLMVAHRSMNMDMKRRLEANDIAGIRPAKSIRLSNVLCVHPRSRAAYEEFNDVVSFDTTYLVNRYKLPFATIVGAMRKDVNCVHNQKFFHGGYPHMTEEFEKYRELERLFQEASDLAYDDNKIKFVKQQLAEWKRDLLSWNDGMIAPTSNAHATKKMKELFLIHM
ncbi:hypothetical protein GH714_014948 [Hevea brasiliensis]|uniref:FAR1 domain-containing protein n=1 Tax=Hevea brasiliensis TaxID=3981 RepID=A0A6A6KU62_HEVBR|nr:hypothetical protein GH714_014948 [Hevea brasiliensis]